MKKNIYIIVLICASLGIIGCAQKKVLLVHPLYTDPIEKKKMSEKDSVYCEVEAYKAVPLQPNNSALNSGNIKLRNENTGDEYSGTYKTKGGLAYGWEMAEMSRQKAQMDNLRKNVFFNCMQSRGWIKAEE